ncbi:MAG: hypothetical protein HXX15_21710 [Rhodopseudomonas sp.]|uniref:His-rich protein BRANT n=1 Tax=Rhodopseudomonas sp. TaxID=1078 RepID=UPI0018214483|nr:hypothetical protein [Rhodopseudomonas sp.]NVN88703.1 hypothetical protein [Rhodopseudomonas sp.]
MIKTISAALLAVSMLAAPAMAAGAARTDTAPVLNANAKMHTPHARIHAQPKLLKSHAQIVRPHHKHVRHHRLHNKMSARTQHHAAKATIKHLGQRG